ALGLIVTLGVSISGLSRTVTAQIEQTNRQALANARTLADAFMRLPAGTDAQRTHIWLDEQTAMLQASSPGARVAVWQGMGANDLAQLGEDAPATFTSEPTTAETRGVGSNQVSAGVSLPAWLRGKNEWSGFTFVPPADTSEVDRAPGV